MKNNNRGFMLAEVVVTATIVLTALISLYITFNKLYKNYNTRSYIYDIDGIYAIKDVISILMDTGDINNILANYTNTTEVKSIELIKSNTCSNTISDDFKNHCESIQEIYNINNMYITKYKSNHITSLKNNVNNTTFKDYLSFLNNKYNFTDGNYTYLFIVEYKNDNTSDDYYYSNLGFG